MRSYKEFRQLQMEYIEQTLKDDRKMKQEMAKVYKSSLEDIQRHIDADIMKFAHKEGVSMAEAKKIISKTDVEKYQSTAKKYVEEKKFTEKANKELRRYNITMRSNRLELMEARINLDIIALGLEEEELTAKHITKQTMAEYERQAGILGMSAPTQEQLNTLARAVLLSDVSGATFSDRVWANQMALRNEVNQVIGRALIRGEHPYRSAENIKGLIRDEYGKQQYAAERILITETARAQTIAGTEAFKKSGVDQYVYIAEPTACKICGKLDDVVFNVKDMVPGENASPMHPFCRCAIAGYVEDLPEVAEVKVEETIPFEPATTIAQANKYGKETLGIPNVKYNGIDIEVANEWNEALRDTFEKFPELQKEMQFVGTIQERNKKLSKDYEAYAFKRLKTRHPNHDDDFLKPYAERQAKNAVKGFKASPNTMAQSFSDGDPVFKDISGVTLNKDKAKNYTMMKLQLEDSEKMKWNPVGSNSPRSILDHEIGHQLDDLLDIRSKEVIQDLYDSRTAHEITADLSEYAWNNKAPNRYAELIAEGWAEYMNNPEPREVARVIGETIEAEYKAKFGGR